ncbi:MAG: PQQ-dependent sugar dehydrogenase [Flavobacteriales bacterium]|nr:PQQ-dependent sugar dehydrogenase [Flavobacteriales bacterium]
MAATEHHRNGGDLDFGPDGLLYIPLGDGGEPGDVMNNAQDPSDPLGDIIRIDVSDPDTTYTVPPTNPWANAQSDTLPEIWASGLRNPFRFGFDALTGDLWLGDVGEGTFEEVDCWPAGNNTAPNFGWRCYEGNSDFNTVGCLPQTDYVARGGHAHNDQAGALVWVVGYTAAA